MQSSQTPRRACGRGGWSKGGRERVSSLKTGAGACHCIRRGEQNLGSKSKFSFKKRCTSGAQQNDTRKRGAQRARRRRRTRATRQGRRCARGAAAARSGDPERRSRKAKRSQRRMYHSHDREKLANCLSDSRLRLIAKGSVESAHKDQGRRYREPTPEPRTTRNTATQRSRTCNTLEIVCERVS